MLLIITSTGKTWAWVVKRPDCDIAVAAGFGYRTRHEAKVGGEIFVAWSKED